MNEFTVEKRSPKSNKSKAGVLPLDPFASLWSDKQLEPAKIAMSVSHSEDFGNIKVSATVSLACDQNESTINKAGELAFRKAFELMEDGWKELHE